MLAPYTTFKIGGPARFFCVVDDQFDALQAYEFAREKNLKTFVLGGGSNILVSDEGFNGLVIRVVNKGIEVLSEDKNQVLLKVASGEVWDEVVKFAVTNNWWGIENLSHIPGSTGAIAVQNVGAYGQEASNVIESVTVFNKDTHQILNLAALDCGFGYRQSNFNTVNKGKYIIFYIIFKLQKKALPNLAYRDLQILFENKPPTLGEIRQAVIKIRDKKFPFPVEAKKGNAGSFFKNPVLTEENYKKLKDTVAKEFGQERAQELEKKKFSNDSILSAVEITSGNQKLSAFAPDFAEVSSGKKATADDRLLNKLGSVKVPAAFLIELCGLRNLQSGGAAINSNQPLVIVNETGRATAQDVLDLANKIKETVFFKTGIKFEFEPELVGY